MNRLLKAALGYRRLGWSIVPLQPRNKSPAIKWRKYQTELASEETIHEWWAANPEYNVGVVTGKLSGIAVIDIDVEALQHLPLIPGSSLRAQSASGGFHSYYRYPANEEVHNSAPLNQPHVRGEGGIVVLPPSIAPSGKRYKWLTDKPSPSLRLVPYRPPALPEAVQNGGGPETVKDRWLAAALQGVQSGSRNATASRLAGYFLKKEMPLDVVMQNMKLWNKNNQPPLTKRELELTVNSVYQTFLRRAKSKIPQPSYVEGGDETFALMGLTDYMTEYGDAEVPWLVKNWIPDRTIAMMVAPPGSFKTWLELALGVSVASGKPFLDRYPVLRTGPVLVIQQEDYHGQLAERIGNIVAAQHPPMLEHSTEGNNFEAFCPPDLPIYMHPDRRLRFDDSIVLQAIQEHIEKIKPVLVIIDPLYSTGDTDDYLAQAVNHMFILKDWRDRFKCSFLLAHHTGKRQNGESEREGLWGSQFLNAFMETGWQIRQKINKTHVSIRRHFKVSKNEDEVMLKFNISTVPPYLFKVEVIENPTVLDDKPPEIQELLSDKGDLTIKDLEAATGMHRTTIVRKLRDLEFEGRVSRDHATGKFHLLNGVVPHDMTD